MTIKHSAEIKCAASQPAPLAHATIPRFSDPCEARKCPGATFSCASNTKGKRESGTSSHYQRHQPSAACCHKRESGTPSHYQRHQTSPSAACCHFHSIPPTGCNNNCQCCLCQPRPPPPADAALSAARPTFRSSEKFSEEMDRRFPGLADGSWVRRALRESSERDCD